MTFWLARDEDGALGLYWREPQLAKSVSGRYWFEREEYCAGLPDHFYPEVEPLECRKAGIVLEAYEEEGTESEDSRP